MYSIHIDEFSYRIVYEIDHGACEVIVYRIRHRKAACDSLVRPGWRIGLGKTEELAPAERLAGIACPGRREDLRRQDAAAYWPCRRLPQRGWEKSRAGGAEAAAPASLSRPSTA